MTIKILTFFEEKLLEWSKGNRYVALDRIEPKEVALMKDMQEETNPSLYSEMREKAIRELGEETGNIVFNSTFGSSSFERYILTPTGYILHDIPLPLNDATPIKDLTDENLYLPITETRNDLVERIDFFHGPYIPNWESDRITISEREINSLVKATIFPNNSYDDSLPPQFTLIPSKKLLMNTDPLYRFMLFYHRVDEHIEDIMNSRPDIRSVYSTDAMGFFDNGCSQRPNDKYLQFYQRLLDRIALIINNTE